MPAPSSRPLLPRQELFAYHVARGASLAQASRLAGYSPQGARQRGSVLMANSDIRLRVEEFRRDWMAERDATIGEAVEETGQVIETALRLNRPTAALKAIELKLRLRGVIHDRRFSLYTDSPDDDLSTCLFDPREDEDPPLEPPAQTPAAPAEVQAIVPPEPAPSVAAAPAPQPAALAGPSVAPSAASAAPRDSTSLPQRKVALNPVPQVLEAEVLDDEPVATTAAPAVVDDDLDSIGRPARPRRSVRAYDRDDDWDDEDADRPRRRRRRTQTLGIVLATTSGIAFGLMVLFLTLMFTLGGGTTILSEVNDLTVADPIDRVLVGRRAKTYRLQLEAGKVYRIDLESRHFDTFLRLEQPEGIHIAQDDDGGDNLNSRLVFRPQVTAQHVIIVTTFDGRIGSFRLTVREQ